MRSSNNTKTYLVGIPNDKENLKVGKSRKVPFSENERITEVKQMKEGIANKCGGVIDLNPVALLAEIVYKELKTNLIDKVIRDKKWFKAMK